jgi:hypothetical protein
MRDATRTGYRQGARHRPCSLRRGVRQRMSGLPDIRHSTTILPAGWRAFLFTLSKCRGNGAPTGAACLLSAHLCGCAAPLGAPPRQACAVWAYLAALDESAYAFASAPGRLSWDVASAGVTRLHLSQSSEDLAERSSCRPSGSPEPPGSGGYEPRPQAPHPTPLK